MPRKKRLIGAERALCNQPRFALLDDAINEEKRRAVGNGSQDVGVAHLDTPTYASTLFAAITP